MRKCWDCGDVKALSEFSKQTSRCKACKTAYKREYRRAHPDKAKIERDRYRPNKPEYVARYRQKNAEKLRAKASERYQRIRERLADWYRENAEVAKAKAAAWRKNNPEKARALDRAKNHARRVAEGKFTAKQVLDLEARQRKRCANPMCRKSIKAKGGKVGYHIDHMQPLARGGSNDISNIQLLCVPCNQKKSAMPYEDWCRETGQLCLMGTCQNFGDL